MRWQVDEGARLEVAPDVVALLHSYAQQEPGDCEAGGLLIGRLSEGNSLLTIERVTVPQPADVRTRRGFERTDPAHGDIVRAAWDGSGGELACWGDWHTHAEPRPTPSAEDLASWRADAEPVDRRFSIIVGTEEIRVWEVLRDGTVRALLIPAGGVNLGLPCPTHSKNCKSRSSNSSRTSTCRRTSRSTRAPGASWPRGWWPRCLAARSAPSPCASSSRARTQPSALRSPDLTARASLAGQERSEGPAWCRALSFCHDPSRALSPASSASASTRSRACPRRVARPCARSTSAGGQ